jgi:glycosyltransferase involved in cell wall biosynthesis
LREVGILDRPSPSKLKVWSVVTSLTTGGAESLVIGLNSCFSEAGVDHTVIALCDAATLGNSCETESRLAGQIVREGGTFVSLGLRRGRDPISGILAMNRLLNDGDPAIIHVHTVRAVPIVAHSRYRGPLVLTHHNSRLSFPKAFFPYIDRMVDHYVAISGETQAIYNAHCRKPARKISNGVSSALLASPERHGSATPCRILSVGAVSAQKNYRLIIAVAKELQSRNPGSTAAIFRIAGGGEGLASLRNEVREAGLDGVVDFLGERSDVPQLLAASDIFLNTSHYEGQSIAMLEAMAAALPIVATDVPGNRDLVAHAETGLLVAHGQPGALADAIASLIERPTLYANLSKQAREAGRHYSVENAASSHLDLYASLVSKG